MKKRRGLARRLAARGWTIIGLLRHFADRQRFFLIPMLLVLLVAGVLLIATGGLSYIAPFAYTLF